MRYIPRIVAACLLAVNGIALRNMVGEKESDVRIALNPNIRKTLSEEGHSVLCQWIFEHIVGKLPYEVLAPVFNDKISKWMDASAGLVQPPLSEEEQIKKLDENFTLDEEESSVSGDEPEEEISRTASADES